MLLGDVIAKLDDDAVATETLMALCDLSLARRAAEAAAAMGVELGGFISEAARRYLNQAPADEWTTLMSAMDRSGDPGSMLLRRSLIFVLDDDRRATGPLRTDQSPDADQVYADRPAADVAPAVQRSILRD